MGRASVFVDTIDGAPTEAGDLVQPLERGILAASDIKTDLYGLVRGAHPGRETDDEITMFKSVGASLEDLAGAVLAYQNAPAAVVAPFDYSSIIWASVFGWIVWRESPEPAVWIGAAIVAGAGAYITRREIALGRNARAAATASKATAPIMPDERP